MRQLTAEEIYELGEECSITTTIDSDAVFDCGHGSYLYGHLAKSGKSMRWLDFCSMIGSNPLGYGGKLKVSPGNEWHNNAAVQLKRKLCAITPGNFVKLAFLCNSGAEAVECAMKMGASKRYHEYVTLFGSAAESRLAKKNVVCAFGGAFHGRTYGALSLNCSKKKHTEAFFLDRGDLSVGMKVKPRAVPVRHLPFPEKDNAEAIRAFKAILKKNPFADATMMFLEVVQGEGGIRVIDAECLQLLVAACRKHDVYLVADEVQTGMMRTGKMFACEHYNFVPDIICLSKALSGGEVPIGATIAAAEFNFAQPGEHSNTFGGNPAACEAALRTIERLEALDKKKLAKNIAMLAEFAPEGLGLMRRTVFSTVEKRNAVTEKARMNGLLIIPAGERAIRWMPPINITADDLGGGIAISKWCMAG